MNSGEGTEIYQINNIIKATLQFVSQSIKTFRQTNQHLHKGQPMRAALETPLNIGVELYIYMPSNVACIASLGCVVILHHVPSESNDMLSPRGNVEGGLGCLSMDFNCFCAAGYFLGG